MSSAMRLCFIGDSLTLGVGDEEGLGWTGRLVRRARQKGHDLTAYNLGVRRETIPDIEARWAEEVTPRLPAAHPRGLVFAFGTNDCLEEDGKQRIAYTDSLDVASRILASARKRMPTLLIGPPPTADARENGRIATLSKGLRELARRHSVSYVDLFLLLRDVEAWQLQLTDGYHPDGSGYELVSALVDDCEPWKALLHNR